MDFKYKTIFAAEGRIKAFNPEEKLSVASLGELSRHLPDFDFDTHSDMLGVSFNCTVVNKINANDDGVGGFVGAEIAKLFVNTFINENHDRKLGAKGFITNYGFSHFGTDLPMTEEEARFAVGPYHIVLGGILWRLIDKKLTNYVENCSEDISCESPVSASWEIGFSNNNLLLLPKGKVDYADGIIVAESDKDYEKISNCLKSNGGNGVWEGFRVCRDILMPALPLGIGLTASPAAAVEGVLAQTSSLVKEKLAAEHEDDCKCDEFEIEKNELKAKLTEVIQFEVDDIDPFEVKLVEGDAKFDIEVNVNELIDITGISNILSDLKKFEEFLAVASIQTVMNSETLHTEINMLTSFADINEEYLKTAQANELREFLEKQVAESASKASEQLKAEKTAIETDKLAISSELEEAKKKIAELYEELNQLKKEKSEATAQDLFNKRMSYFDEKFELAKEDKVIISNDLKEVANDEIFASYQQKMDVLLKGKEKGKQAVASVTTVVNEDKLVSKALDNATLEVVTVTAGVVKDEPKGLFEKYSKYFALNDENYQTR